MNGSTFDDVNLYLTEVFAHQARRAPDKPAIVCAGVTTTWRAFDLALNRFANALLGAGLAKGERAAVLMSPGTECVVAMFGIVRAGCVLVPCGTMLSREQLGTLLANSGARMVFATAEFAADLQAVTAGLDDVRLVAVGFEAQGWTSWAEFHAGSSEAAPAVAFAPLDPFSIMYSSGTTGLPKGVVHSQRARTYFAVSNTIEMRFDSSSVTAITTALYTAASWLMLVPTLFAGGTVHLLQRFDCEGLLRTIERERITHTFVVPSQIIMLLESGLLSRFELASLRTILSAGSPLRPDVKTSWLRHAGQAFHELYGFTEGAATLLKPADHERKFMSVGAPLLGTEFVVVGANDRPVAPGEAGELCGRCPGLMTAYHDNPPATEAAIWRDEQGRSFMRSGDIGRMDEDGFVYILDRKKDMIISGGLNVYPTDLEAVFGEHPAVSDVSVIGIPHEKWGETPLACIVRSADADASLDEILAWANARLAKYQRVHQAVLMSELPRNALGKVLKRELRALHAGETT